MIEAIEKLLKSDLTSYKIGKDTGISVQQIDRYRKYHFKKRIEIIRLL